MQRSTYTKYDVAHFVEHVPHKKVARIVAQNVGTNPLQVFCNPGGINIFPWLTLYQRHSYSGHVDTFFLQYTHKFCNERLNDLLQKKVDLQPFCNVLRPLYTILRPYGCIFDGILFATWVAEKGWFATFEGYWNFNSPIDSTKIRVSSEYSDTFLRYWNFFLQGIYYWQWKKTKSS